MTYADEWLSSPRSRPISLSLPLQPSQIPHRGSLVESWFENLLPESREIRARLQARFHLATDRTFDLLTEIGRECIGAIQLVPADTIPPNVRTIEATAQTEAQIAQLIRRTTSIRPFGGDDPEDFRISLAGMQEKTALLKHEGQWCIPHGSTPTTHLLKLPLGDVGVMQADMSHSVENEWLCAQIVAAYGLPMAACEIATFEDQRVLVVERFDRRLMDTGWLARLPQEDFCQALGTPASLKYESDGGPGIADSMQLLRGSTHAREDRLRFFRTLLVFWLLAAPDGHAKNFSLQIMPKGRYCLTPNYDILSGYPILGSKAKQIAPQKLKLAMALLGSKNKHYKWRTMSVRHWVRTGERCGLAAEVTSKLIHAAASDTQRVVDQVSNKLPAGFPQQVSNPIFDGLISAAKRIKL